MNDGWTDCWQWWGGTSGKGQFHFAIQFIRQLRPTASGSPTFRIACWISILICRSLGGPPQELDRFRRNETSVKRFIREQKVKGNPAVNVLRVNVVERARNWRIDKKQIILGNAHQVRRNRGSQKESTSLRKMADSCRKLVAPGRWCTAKESNHWMNCTLRTWLRVNLYITVSAWMGFF